jgi:hypothetical protein
MKSFMGKGGRMLSKKPRKLALWASAFPNQHANLTSPATRHRAERLEQAKKLRSQKLVSRQPSKIVRSKRIRARRPERAKQDRICNAEVAEWLKLPENMWCKAMLAINGHMKRATQCHHSRGRSGALLLDKRFWMPVSDAGHRWIHENVGKARELGLICEKGLWNTPAP